MVVLISLVVLTKAALPQTTPNDSAATAQITGRITDAKGVPRGWVGLTLTPLNPDERTPAVTVYSKYDGTVSFSKVQRKKYKLSVPGGTFTIRPECIDGGAAEQIEIGDIVVEPAVKSDFTLDKILVASPTAWHAPSVDLKPYTSQTAQKPCFASFETYTTVEAFVGSGAKAIHILRLPLLPARFSDGSAVPIAAKPDDIRVLVQSVWLGFFRSASCNRPWTEGAPPTQVEHWPIEADVEYRDGRHAVLRTDGIHVHVTDREGRNWFIRIWPAAG